MFRFIFSSLILILFLPNDLSAHSGRLDSNCGHNCSAESIRKGLCTSYHYHYANCSALLEIYSNLVWLAFFVGVFGCADFVCASVNSVSFGRTSYEY